MKIIGLTYEYKNELRKAGLLWNPASKSWDGELNDSFAAEQIRRAIASGKLHELNPMDNRNGPGCSEIDNQII